MSPYKMDGFIIIGVIGLIVAIIGLGAYFSGDVDKQCAKIDAKEVFTGQQSFCVKKDGSIWSVPHDHKD